MKNYEQKLRGERAPGLSPEMGPLNEVIRILTWTI